MLPRQSHSLFDNLGRRYRTQHVDELTEVRVETTGYNDQGQIWTVDSPEGLITYGYDAFERLTSTSFERAISDSQSSLVYTYDELGRLSSVDLSEINGASHSDLTRYYYHLDGSLHYSINSNDIAHLYEYDELDRLERLTQFLDTNANFVAESNERLAEFVYGVRIDGKRISSTETFWYEAGGDPDEFLEYEYDYDEVGRLTDESLTIDESLFYDDTFVYDLTGNRYSYSREWGPSTGNDDFSIAYAYDNNDRLISGREVVCFWQLRIHSL